MNQMITHALMSSSSGTMQKFGANQYLNCVFAYRQLVFAELSKKSHQDAKQGGANVMPCCLQVVGLVSSTAKVT